MEYRVIWEIDIDANSPTEAATKALEIQRRNGSSATVFQVNGTMVDLEDHITPCECSYCVIARRPIVQNYWKKGANSV